MSLYMNQNVCPDQETVSAPVVKVQPLTTKSKMASQRGAFMGWKNGQRQALNIRMANRHSLQVM
jgi:hypothetical protein